MSIPVTFNVGTLPVGFCWTGPQAYAASLFGPGGIITGSIPGAGTPVIVSASAPGPSDQDKLWAKLVGGYLEGIYQFNGFWLRPHPLQPTTSFRTIYMGSEAALWLEDGGDGTNPLVSAPTPTTGSFWQRDLTFGADDGSSIFKMPIGVGVNPTAYDGNPATSIGIGATGGEERHLISVSETPPHTHLVHQGQVEHGATDHAVFQNTTSDGQLDAFTGYGGGPTPGTNTVNVSHQNLPPFVGVFFVKRTGRVYIQG